jgi:cyanophycin synthetase
MRIDSIKTLSGPNIYSHKPVLAIKLYMEDLQERESRELPGFNERLIQKLPGLKHHHCSKGKPGGFIERLYEGTFFGHIVEHITLELTELAGVGTFHGKTRVTEDPTCYLVLVEYTAEHGTRFLAQVAVDLVQALIDECEFPIEEKLEQARKLIARTELGPSTRAIVDAATERGIPWFRIGDASLVQIGYGKNRKHIQAAISDGTRAVAVEIAGDKELTKNLLEQAAVPVPRGFVASTEEEAIQAMKELDQPVVVKPLDGRQGKGVSLNLSTPEEVRHAFLIAREHSGRVIVEELFSGRNYRVLVIGGKMVAASERLPASVEGDGHHTILELVEIENADPRRGDGHEKALTKLVIDSVASEYLKKAGRTPDDVPRAGETVALREGINLSTGGTARDVTDEVHPSVARLSERVARIVGMDICGVDLVLEDISQPFRKDGGGVIEVNASPGLRMHISPSEGTPRDVGSAIVDLLYPEGAAARIPIISITGTNGKTTVTRMIGHMLGTAGQTVGMTTTDGIYVGGSLLSEGDMTGPYSARAVLSDPAVEVAVLETARGGIARRGLGYDWSDISVITNIAGDHIGQDGIRSIEDIVYIKSLVAERVREGGTLVLNADDEHLSRLVHQPRVSRLKRQIVYFSLHENSLLVKKHRAMGGTAFFVRNGWIIEARHSMEYKVARVDTIPVTLSGAAEYNVANCLAATAVARAHGLSRGQIAETLMAFQSTVHNAGRTNLFQLNGGFLMLDYGHNADAFKAVCRLASQWKDRRVTGIIGVPGDRADDVVREAGRAAADGFHRIVLKEDRDRRGRAPGEIIDLLHTSIKEIAPDLECLIRPDEVEAVKTEIASMEPGDVVVVFYEKLQPVLQILEAAGATPVSEIETLFVSSHLDLQSSLARSEQNKASRKQMA